MNFSPDREKRKTLIAVTAAVLATAAMGLEGFVLHSSAADIDVGQAKALIDAGALVVDVRGDEAFDGGHLGAAMHISLAELSTGAPTRLAGAQARPVLVYSDDGVTAGPAARKALEEDGFTKVFNLKGGIRGWAAAGLPLAGR
jgi:rhodanese-related sulfurtransferase